MDTFTKELSDFQNLSVLANFWHFCYQVIYLTAPPYMGAIKGLYTYITQGRGTVAVVGTKLAHRYAIFLCSLDVEI